MCLVCGDIIGSIESSECQKKCKFKVHSRCFSINCKLSGYDGSFCCSMVKYQFRPSELSKVSNVVSSDDVKYLQKISKSRGRVNTAKYHGKRKRWENEEIQCEYCKKWYGLNESDHVALYCEAAIGSPITDRNRRYPFASLKRFRHISWKVP